jgi:peptidoglycan/LPS O-acetylase OafA/YrhL
VRSKGRINFKSFYFKRAMRILPAYYVVLALYVFWPEFREKPSLEPAWRFVFFVMNIGPKAEAFSHAWS